VRKAFSAWKTDRRARVHAKSSTASRSIHRWTSSPWLAFHWCSYAKVAAVRYTLSIALTGCGGVLPGPQVLHW
jgi:hypothetical protein